MHLHYNHLKLPTPLVRHLKFGFSQCHYGYAVSELPLVLLWVISRDSAARMPFGSIRHSKLLARSTLAEFQTLVFPMQFRAYTPSAFSWQCWRIIYLMVLIKRTHSTSNTLM